MEQKSPFNQFATSKTGASWRQQQIVISGNALKTITFMDTTPNMFMIQNPTDATLYVGISNIPTPTNYEFKIQSNTTKTFGRPVPVSELFIYNVSNADVAINLFSVLDEFDLTVLADTTVKIDDSLASDIKGDGICKGFGSGVSLPKGSNKIGSVDIATMPTMALPSAIQTSLDTLMSDNDKLIATSEKTGYTNLMSIIKNLRELRGGENDTTTLNDLLGELGQLEALLGTVNSSVGNVGTAVESGSDGISSALGQEFSALRGDDDATVAAIINGLLEVKTAIGVLSNKVENMTSSGDDRPSEILSSSLTLTANTDSAIALTNEQSAKSLNIVLITNDGSADITVTFATDDGDVTFILKSSESLTDIKLPTAVKGISFLATASCAMRYVIGLS